MKQKQLKRAKAKVTTVRARSKKVPMKLQQLGKQVPIELKRLKQIISEKAVDFVLPITRFAQSRLHSLETKLSRT